MAAAAPLLAEASQAFGQLAGLGRILPNPDLLVRPYMRREAVLSSRIENTHTSFSELVAFEFTREEAGDGSAREVLNYVAALEYGLRHVSEHGITMDLVRGIHRTLMQGARGERTSTPGEIRMVQNHIGGGSTDPADAHFVPPPPEYVPELLERLFEYLSAPKPGVPTLTEAAWMHYQFETIHPFLDGNGRVGRVLIPLLFALRNEMPHPLLYLSPYFEHNRSRYYDLLFAVSARSEWAAWHQYFLEGVRDQSRTAIELAERILDLGAKWQRLLDEQGAPRTAHRLAELVHQQLAVDGPTAAKLLGVSKVTAYKAIYTLVDAGILVQHGERARDRVYIAGELRDMMEAAS